jgi:hypothetical protein
MKRFIFIFSAALLTGSLPLLAEDTSQAAGSDSPAATPAPAAATATTAPSTAAGAPAAPSASPAAEKSKTSPSDLPPDLKPAPLDQPIGLIPETVPDTKKPAGPVDAVVKEAEKKLKKKEDLSADSIKRKIHFREVQNQALNDDRIMGEWETAQAAKTDMEKRTVMKSYYNHLFDKMLKIDPGLKLEIEASRKSRVNRYNQNRVRPAGEPLEMLGE